MIKMTNEDALSIIYKKIRKKVFGRSEVVALETAIEALRAAPQGEDLQVFKEAKEQGFLMTLPKVAYMNAYDGELLAGMIVSVARSYIPYPNVGNPKTVKFTFAYQYGGYWAFDEFYYEDIGTKVFFNLTDAEYGVMVLSKLEDNLN